MLLRNPGSGVWVVVLGLLTQALAYQELTDASLHHIPGGGPDFDIKTGSLLAPILIPRVPGTPGSTAVQHHFADFFRRNLPEWTIEWHNSTSKTPATGDQEVPFRSLIIRRDPPWAKKGDVGYLTLAAHYDSLYEPAGFIGAIDSAAPCAMLMHVAKSIEQGLARKWAAMQESGDAGLGLEEEKGVQILLLDGEEAWVTWTATDSIYGARALAAHWDTDVYPESAEHRSPIEAIKLFLLVDLLGGPDPTVPSYFRPTHWLYQHMSKIERRMRQLGLLASKPETPFLPDSGETPENPYMGYIADDHVPFMVRGVPILHMIPNPFPKLWHTMDDDGEHLDPATVNDWSKILTAFAAEWMELDAHLAATQPLSKEDEDSLIDHTEL
ncbi:glutaminyl-peptide cyclotransferase [Microdochium bolleyi]|uniref:Peptide hydrolase n=1 Tax=Microdochium bolleyi TaxID=196109 RepID=A0A136J2D3_9PEZI|nr:glutaminyl-peptide cyclotransferase [Microdochium bolleyi]